MSGTNEEGRWQDGSVGDGYPEGAPGSWFSGSQAVQTVDDPGSGVAVTLADPATLLSDGELLARLDL